MKTLDTSLYFITDSTVCPPEEFLGRVEAALKGGVSIVQLREKDISTRDYIQKACQVHELTRTYHVPLIIDDRVDVALAIGAEGVHVGQSDMPVDMVRRLAGPDLIIGATTKTVDQAKEAYEKGADYCGAGAVFPTTTHVKTRITDLSVIKEICEAVPIPVNAIGGLNRDNIHVLSAIPLAGICVVSAIMKAPDPCQAALALRKRAEECGIIPQK